MRRTSSLIVRLDAGRAEIPRADGRAAGDRAYEQHLQENMPSAADKKLLLEIIANEKKWIAEKTGARDPLASIGEVRKSAINL